MPDDKKLVTAPKPKPLSWLRALHPAIFPVGPFGYEYPLPEYFKAAQEKVFATIPYTGIDPKQWQKDYGVWANFLNESQGRMQQYDDITIVGVSEKPGIFQRFAAWVVTLGEEPAAPPEEWEEMSAVQRQKAIARKQFLEEEAQYFDYAASNMARAEFFANLYALLPKFIAHGGSSLDEYCDTIMGSSIEKLSASDRAFLSEEDVALARKAITNAIAKGGEVLETEDVPDFLQLEPEDEALVAGWLEAPRPTPKPTGISVITVEEITKAISAGAPLAKLPEGISDEEWLKTMSLMGIPEEALAGAITYEEMVKPYADAISERTAMIQDVLAGVRSWEEPEKTFGEKALFAILQPMQFVADTMRPWIEHVSYATAGWATIQFQKMIFWNEGGVEKLYKQNVESGMSMYTAIRQAWKDWDAPWGLKLVIEIATDPITFIPGLGLKVPAIALRKIGLKAAGDALWNFNKAVWRTTDLPFDIGKGLLAKMRTKGWMAPAQLSKSHLDDFTMHLQQVTEAHSGKIFKEIDYDDMTLALRHSVFSFKNNPQTDDIYTRFGRMLSQAPPMEPGDIAIWAKSIGGKLTREEIDKFPSIVDNVNNVLLDEVGRVGTTAQNAKRLAIIFMAEDTPLTMKRLISNIGRYTRKYTNRVETIVAIGTKAEAFKVAKMVEALMASQKRIVDASARSSYYRHRAFAGMVVALQDTVDKMDKAIWRRALDRSLVRPAAEAYLGNPAYPVWNALESMGVSLLEGVVPRQAKMEAYLMMTHGLSGRDPRFISRSASDVAGFFGSAPARAGGVHFMPGKDWMEAIVAKLPEKVQNVTPRWVTQAEWSEWLGRKYIELSDVWGNSLRRNFVMRKMSQYLAEHAYDVAGKDLSKTIKTLIGEPPIPKRSSLKLGSHELKQDMVSRIMTGDKANILAMKEMLTQSSLSQGEQMRILRQVSDLSPQARTLGEQLVMQGKILTDYDTINDFCRIVGNQTIMDSRPLPPQISETFAHMANGITSMEVKDAGELMQVFQHYEVMVESAGNIPHTLMSTTMAESRELRRLGKYGAVDKLWRVNRGDMAEMVASVDTSMEMIRNRILSHKHLLKPDEQVALEALLERGSSRDILRESTLQADRQLLDDFWATPKVERDYGAMDAERLMVWEEYRKENAVLGAGDFVMRKEYADLYYKLPKEKLFPVDATGRALSAHDCARVMGCNVDSLTTGIIDTVALHDRYYFIEMVKQNAKGNPTLFKGFTDEKIGMVYDDILRGLHMAPEDIAKGMKMPEVPEGRLPEAFIKATKDDILQMEKGIERQRLVVEEARRRHEQIIPPEAKLEMPKTGTEELEVLIDLERVTPDMVKAAETLRDELKVLVDLEGAATGIKRFLAEAEAYKFKAPAAMPMTIQTQKILQQVEGARQQLITLKMTKALTPDEEVALHAWVDNVAGGMDDIFGKEIVTPPRVKPVEGLEITHLAQEIADDFHMEARMKGKHVGSLNYSIKDKYMTIRMISVPEVARRQGIASNLLDDAIRKAEARNKILLSGAMTDEGKELLLALQKRGIIKLSKPPAEIPRPSWFTIEKAPPKAPTRGLVSMDDWQTVRQDALDFAQKEYYKSFADYTNETIVDYAMRMIFPYWTYHMYRWFFLPRTFLRKPGVAAAWGKYYDYSDYGWINIPGTDLSLNPFVGSVMGVTFTLGRYDFKSYYENLGWFGESLDFIQRRGFFPGAHIMLPLALTPIFSGRPPELGEVLPPLQKFGLEALVASPIPGVSDSATWLRNKIFHDNFRDYYIETIIDGMQVEAGGKLIEGQSGADLWHKRNRGDKLTEEEQELWDRASEKTAWYGMLRSVYPGVRLREQEMLDAYKKVTKIFEEQCGMSEEYQLYLWRHNMRPTDVLGGIPWEMQQTLDQMWEYKIWFGRGATLMPPDVSNLMSVINEFWNIVDDYQVDRVAVQATDNEGFLHPTATVHYDGREWREANAANWTSYNDRFESLKGLEKYQDIPWTPEQQVELYKMQGYAVPTRGMEKEILDIYFSIELEKKKDPYTGEEEWDYLGFWLKREVVRNALPEELRAGFDAYIRRYETPLEHTFRLASATYMRGYWATSRIILDDYTEEQKALIAEFYADGTSLTRKEEIRAVVVPETGRQLISEWDSRRSDAKSALREASPHLDFWLYVFGYTTTVKTPEARIMVDKWEANRDSILTML